MSNSIFDVCNALMYKIDDAITNLKSLLGEDWREKIRSGKFSNEAHEQYLVYLEACEDLATLRCVRPTTIYPGINKPEDAELLNYMEKRTYPILDYLKIAVDCCDRIHEDSDTQIDFEEALTKLIKFSYFNPDQWFKREDEFPPLFIKGNNIKTYLLDRYKEAVYSYIYGFNNASIALCRSILEGIIEDKLGYKSNNTATLHEKIEFFMKTLKNIKNQQVVWKMGHVRELANKVLHNINESCNEKKVKDALLGIRDLINVAY